MTRILGISSRAITWYLVSQRALFGGLNLINTRIQEHTRKFRTKNGLKQKLEENYWNLKWKLSRQASHKPHSCLEGNEENIEWKEQNHAAWSNVEVNHQW